MGGDPSCAIARNAVAATEVITSVMAPIGAKRRIGGACRPSSVARHAMSSGRIDWKRVCNWGDEFFGRAPVDQLIPSGINLGTPTDPCSFRG